MVDGGKIDKQCIHCSGDLYRVDITCINTFKSKGHMYKCSGCGKMHTNYGEIGEWTPNGPREKAES